MAFGTDVKPRRHHLAMGNRRVLCAKIPPPHFLMLNLTANLHTAIFFLFTFTLTSVAIAAAETHHGIQEQVPIGQQQEAEKPGEVTPTGSVVETTAVELIIEQSPAAFNPSGCFRLSRSALPS